jgi:hypothetical protein
MTGAALHTALRRTQEIEFNGTMSRQDMRIESRRVRKRAITTTANQNIIRRANAGTCFSSTGDGSVRAARELSAYDQSLRAPPHGFSTKLPASA